MTRVVVSPQARDDLLQIVIALAAVAGIETAEKWDRKIWQAVDDVAQFPGSGAPRPALGDHVRIVPVPPYVVLYEHVRGDDVVHLLRVVRGRRNITKTLLRS
jgi:plasmid stabilization system protein ParE